MNPPASAGMAHHHSHGAWPSREGAPSRTAAQGLELEGAEGRGVPESHPSVLWFGSWPGSPGAAWGKARREDRGRV